MKKITLVLLFCFCAVGFSQAQIEQESSGTATSNDSKSVFRMITAPPGVHSKTSNNVALTGKSSDLERSISAPLKVQSMEVKAERVAGPQINVSPEYLARASVNGRQQTQMARVNSGYIARTATGEYTPPTSNTRRANLLTEGFDDITTLAGAGYTFVNASDVIGTTDWAQGVPTVFESQAGAPDSYVSANFNNTAGTVINNWMITPQLNLENGDVITFWTRTVTANTFPDRLEVRLSPDGSTTAPASPTDVGSYTELLLEINPTLTTGGYPDVWTEFTVTVTGLTGAVDTNVAFRYFVTDAGPTGVNSNYIGIDSLSIDEAAGGGGLELPITFEGQTVTFSDFNGSATQVIANPDASGVNTSANVAENVIPMGAAFAGVNIVVPIDLTDDKLFTMNVWSPLADTPVLLKLEGGPNPAIERQAILTTSSAWEDITFDFSSEGAVTYESVTIFMNFNMTDPANQTFYWDNLVQMNGGGGGGPMACNQEHLISANPGGGVGSSVDSAFNGASDLVVGMGENFTIDTIDATFLTFAPTDPPTTANIVYYEDASGLPGAVIGSETVVPTIVSSAPWVNPIADQYVTTMSVTPFTFAGDAASDTTYWIEITMGTATNQATVFWEYNRDSVEGNPLAQFDGTTWAYPDLDGDGNPDLDAELIYNYAGTCEPMGTGGMTCNQEHLISANPGGGVGSSVDSAFNGASDLVVGMGENFTIDTIDATFLTFAPTDPPTTANIVYYEDASGLPGAVIGSETVVPTIVSSAPWVNPIADQYVTTMSVTPFTFAGDAASDTTYWIEITMGTATNQATVFWEYNRDSVEGNPLAQFDGTTWAYPDLDGDGNPDLDAELIYNYAGICEPIGGGGGCAPGSISTLFAGGNGGAAGGAVYFDITVGTADIEISTLDMNTPDPGAFTMDVYVFEGTYVGNQNDPTPWGTPVAIGSGTGAGAGVPSTATLDTPITMSAGSTYAVALIFDATHAHQYTNGDGTNQNYSNGDITLDLGSGSNAPFTDPIFDPRVWNGGVGYCVVGAGGSLTFPITHESQMVTFNDFNGSATQQISNPDASGVNTSATVAENFVPMNAAFAGTNIVIDVDLTNNKYFAMDVWSPLADTPVLLKLEGGPNPPVERQVNLTTSGAWEEVVFDFSSEGAITFESVTLFMNFNMIDPADQTFYWDNLERRNTPPPPPAPANDLCENAIPMGCGDIVSGTTIDATDDSAIAPTCDTTVTAPGVWYVYEDTTGLVTDITITMCNGTTDYDSKLSVYTGDCGGLICEVGNDDTCGLQSEVSFQSDGATTFYILVHGFGGATGNFEIEMICTPVPPPNDMIANSIDVDEIGFPYTDPSVATAAATFEAGSPVGCDNNGARGVWYNFVPEADGTATATIVSPGLTGGTPDVSAGLGAAPTNVSMGLGAGGDLTFTVNNGPLAGSYDALAAAFGGEFTADLITGDTILMIDDDTTGDPNDACDPLLNGADLSGKIAIARRGACAFTDKVISAQNAGAIAVIVINNQPGGPIVMGGDNPDITIPSLMIGDEDGEALLASFDTWLGLSVTTGTLEGNSYDVLGAEFGGEFTSTLITGQTVLMIDDDTTGDPNDACDPLLNGADLSGKIAIARRGACAFTDKVIAAQNAGAIMVIVINNQPGGPIVMGGANPDITIPSLMIGDEDGAALLNSSIGFNAVTFYTAPNENAVETDLELVDWFDNQCLPGVSASIPTVAGQAYYVFVANHDGITDIVIDGTNLGTADNIIEGFVYYPNPAGGTLNLRAQETIERVAIYNMLGQKVLDQNVNAPTSELNVSELATGTYILQVSVNGITGNYQILKK